MNRNFLYLLYRKYTRSVVLYTGVLNHLNYTPNEKINCRGSRTRTCDFLSLITIYRNTLCVFNNLLRLQESNLLSVGYEPPMISAHLLRERVRFTLPRYKRINVSLLVPSALTMIFKVVSFNYY